MTIRLEKSADKAEQCSVSFSGNGMNRLRKSDAVSKPFAEMPGTFSAPRIFAWPRFAGAPTCSGLAPALTHD